jgi:hypothetical protein
MQKQGISAKKKSKKFPKFVSPTNQIKSIQFLLNAETRSIIKYYLVICILLC